MADDRVLRNVTRGVDLVESPVLASSMWSRFMGLMGKGSLGDGEGLILEPANGIHMFFMRFAIDAVFVDRDWKVLHISPSIKPWRVSKVVRKSKRVIELPAGHCAQTGTQLGDTLALV